MNYFVADSTAETGIRQLAADKVVLNPDGTLRFRHPDTGTDVHVPREDWSTDFDRAVVPAYNRLCADIARLETELERLKRSRSELLSASPRLQRLVKQMRLF